MIKQILGLFILLFYSSYTYANCQQNINDPFEFKYEIPIGQLKGQCLENDRIRTIRVLNEAERVAYSHYYGGILKDQNYSVVANFFHNSQFWIALIPRAQDAIQRTILQVEFFPPEAVAAHTQLRFDLSPEHPILLIGQNEKNRGFSDEIFSFISSFEATFSIDGPRFNLIKAVQDIFVLSARMLSLEQAKDYIVNIKKHKNQQFVLNFNSIEKNKLLQLVLARSENLDQNLELYRLLGNNCTTNIYDIFNQIRKLPPIDFLNEYLKIKIPSRNLLSMFPVSAEIELKTRKILDHELQSLEME